MKRMILIGVLTVLITSCAPVLKGDYIKEAIHGLPVSEIKETPSFYRGRLFLLGGIIVETRLTGEGTQIEAVYVPVDSMGYLKEIKKDSGRFLALYPGEEGFLDPLIYRRGREITVAGEFIELKKGRIDGMEYTYPFFKIRDIYLWEERKAYYMVPPPDWHYPYWWDYPWWRYRLPPYSH